ncbi:hypothetical protein [Botryobacter ruber]|uniref:hypothetical protein n=1 Tax=Botryobacter ruber TaxID=2171629 RepID=UPI000F64FCC5|nr:hypothetical protein [Botryobacter ruber]
MKIKFFITCSFIFAACTLGYSQKVMEVNINDKDCIHVLDGLISSPNESAPDNLAHFEQAVTQEKLEKLGFSNRQCVIVKSSADIDIENFIYRKVHDQVQQIGTKYKIPIAVNGKLTSNHTDRRNQLSKLKAEEVKKIKFLNKAEAQAKYGDKVVFGLIEITV